MRKVTEMVFGNRRVWERVCHVCKKKFRCLAATQCECYDCKLAALRFQIEEWEEKKQLVAVARIATWRGDEKY
jgi:hypothetical protein